MSVKLAIGMAREALLDKVENAGYVYESATVTDDRYGVRSVRAWLVNDSFPGLRSGEIGEARLRGVDKIHYELNLGAAPNRLSGSPRPSARARWPSPWFTAT